MPVVVPVLGVASCLVLLWQQEARTWAFAGVLVAVGLLLYLVTALPRRRAAAREDAGSPGVGVSRSGS